MKRSITEQASRDCCAVMFCADGGICALILYWLNEGGVEVDILLTGWDWNAREGAETRGDVDLRMTRGNVSNTVGGRTLGLRCI